MVGILRSLCLAGVWSLESDVRQFYVGVSGRNMTSVAVKIIKPKLSANVYHYLLFERHRAYVFEISNRT